MNIINIKQLMGGQVCGVSNLVSWARRPDWWVWLERVATPTGRLAREAISSLIPGFPFFASSLSTPEKKEEDTKGEELDG